MLRLTLSRHQVQCYSFRRWETGLFAWRIPSARLLGTFSLPSLWLLAEEMGAGQRQWRSTQDISLFPHCRNIQEQFNHSWWGQLLRLKREEIQHRDANLQHVKELMAESKRRLERQTPCFYSLRKHGHDQWGHQLEGKVQWGSYFYYFHWRKFTKSAHFHCSQSSWGVRTDQQAQNHPNLRIIA